jgi:hypothetical protein
MGEWTSPPERLHCRVDGCRRTRLNKDPTYYEWVCQKCYGPVPAPIRSEHKNAKAEIRKLKRARCEDMTVVEAAYRRADSAWEAVVNSAAGGLPDELVLRDMGLL